MHFLGLTGKNGKIDINQFRSRILEIFMWSVLLPSMVSKIVAQCALKYFVQSGKVSWRNLLLYRSGE